MLFCRPHLRVYIQGPQASGVDGGVQVLGESREDTRVPTAFVVARPRYYSANGAYARKHTYTFCENTYTHLKTYFTHFTPVDLKRATGDAGLIFQEEKQI